MGVKRAPEKSAAESEATSAKTLKPNPFRAQNDMLTFFGRVQTGQFKKSSDAQKQEAKEALSVYTELGTAEREQFVQSFQNNKHTKTFGFIKEFREKLTARKLTEESLTEKYMTRIFAIAYMQGRSACTSAYRAGWHHEGSMQTHIVMT